MEMNKTIDNLLTNYDETDGNDIQDNLNTSLTSLTLNESTEEKVNHNEIENKKEPTTLGQTKMITLPVRLLPTHNVPEKILFCLDTSRDDEFTAFKTGDGSTYPALYMLKRVIDIFVQNKNFIDSRHEFALMTLENKDIRWIKDFTNNPTDIVISLKEIQEHETSDEFKLSKLLDIVWENVTIPKSNKPLNIPPPFVVRLILLYNRSSCTPVPREDYEELLSNPYFTIDVIMTHEESPVEKYQEIFNCLQMLDDKSYSYKFGVGRNVTMLHDSMAKLLSHPLQRPPQTLAAYEFNPDNEKQKSDKED